MQVAKTRLKSRKFYKRWDGFRYGSTRGDTPYHWEADCMSSPLKAERALDSFHQESTMGGLRCDSWDWMGEGLRPPPASLGCLLWHAPSFGSKVPQAKRRDPHLGSLVDSLSGVPPVFPLKALDHPGRAKSTPSAGYWPTNSEHNNTLVLCWHIPGAINNLNHIFYLE